MAGKNSKIIIEELVDGAVSATEYTGALQKISLDPEEVARFHDEYVGDKSAGR